MRKIVFADAIVGNVSIPLGILRIENNPTGYSHIVIRDEFNNNLVENCIPLPKNLESMVFDNWIENPSINIIWPLDRNYIRNFEQRKHDNRNY